MFTVRVRDKNVSTNLNLSLTYTFKNVTYEHFCKVNEYNFIANLDASDLVILGNEASSEMLKSKTGMSQK